MHTYSLSQVKGHVPCPARIASVHGPPYLLPRLVCPITVWVFFVSVHTASTASGSSGTLRPHQEVFSVYANSTQFECSSGRVGYDSDAPSAHVCRLTYFYPLHTFVKLRIARVEIMTQWGKSETLTNYHTRRRNGKMTAEKRFPYVSFVST